MTAPAIVVQAHNRPDALADLLASIEKAEITEETPAVISIDGGGVNQAEVAKVAGAFVWPHGPTTVIEHEPLGLVDHFYWCGNLTDEYGSIVLLEDDLVVAPSFWRWALAALAHADPDDRIAGVSLATPHFDGYQHLPFEPVIDGGDAIFAQIPWYDGMAWTAAMWTRFRDHQTNPSTPLHSSLGTLGDDEWFPAALRYLVETGRYYLLPRHAHATNRGAPGAHFDEHTDYFQVPLSMRSPTSWRLHDLDDCLAVYDDHMELAVGVLKQLVPELGEFDLTVDLLGGRDLGQAGATHVITTRTVDNPIRTWGASMHPLVANLVHDVRGDAIRLAAAVDVVSSKTSEAESLATLKHHAARGRTPSTRGHARELARSLRQKLTHDR